MRSRPRLRPRTILLISWGVLVAYAFPGYMSFDSCEQLLQARTEPYGDWHPPMMAAYWRVIEFVVHGPFGMLVLQTSLFLWGLYTLLRDRLGERTAAWVAAAMLLYPPIFTPMAMVWKDAQMAGFLLAGTALAMNPSKWARCAAVVLLVGAAGVRDNGAAALPFLVLWIARSWSVRRGILMVLAASLVSLAIAGAAVGINRGLTDQREWPWYRTLAIMDIAGTIRYADPMTDDEIHRLLDGSGFVGEKDLQARLRAVYSSRVWFDLSFNAPEKVVFISEPSEAEMMQRKRAWWQLVREHPRAYLRHRFEVMRNVLGLSDWNIWEPVGQTFYGVPDHKLRLHQDHSKSTLQWFVGKQYRRLLGESLLYRAWAYALLGLLLLGYGVVRRDLAVAALAGSGLMYECTYFIAAAAPDFRYSHWMVVTTCTAAVMVFVDRWRRGRATQRSHERDEPAGASTTESDSAG